MQTIALGFMGIILLGAVLLMLPFSNRDGAGLPFLDALFTSTSATCVTGLILYDTYTQFTVFGQIVLLCLIQIGGLGFMTVGTMFLLLTRRKIGLAERGLLTDSISAFQIGGIVRLVRRVIFGTAAIEGAGFLLLALRFCPRLGLGTGLYYALFHSVSAFCNAGFDLMGRYGAFSSLVPYQSDPLVNLTVMALITLGGLGFIVWDDIWEHRHHFSRYKLHTKIVLVSSAALFIAGAVLFYMVERGNTLAGMPPKTAILASLFQSVSPRTAGFNTVELDKLTGGGVVLSIVLMAVGASPGSTGGGIKTTTITVVVLSMISYIRGAEDTTVFHRRIDRETVRRAHYHVTVYLLLMVISVFLLLVIQPLPVQDVVFEVFSALGTVGMSAGTTRELYNASKAIILLLMYVGRVGSLTLLTAFTERAGRAAGWKYPQEKIIIG